MARIAVFDSGLGSLSIIRPMQQAFKSSIIYFADQQSYPYGAKSHDQLGTIIGRTIRTLQDRFSPDITVVASNTPSLMLDLASDDIVDTKPPISEAQMLSRTGSIGVLATRAAIKQGLAAHIARSRQPGSRIVTMDGTAMVDLVESGRFPADEDLCRKVIRRSLGDVLRKNDIDVVVLSSTHLPFLRPLLKTEYDGVKFVDPGEAVAARIRGMIGGRQPGRNSLRVFASGDAAVFQAKLRRLGMRSRVRHLAWPSCSHD